MVKDKYKNVGEILTFLGVELLGYRLGIYFSSFIYPIFSVIVCLDQDTQDLNTWVFMVK